jgi:hypothetical protein
MNVPLFHPLPRWLTRIGQPDPRVTVYLLVLLTDLAVFVVLHAVGMDSATALGLLTAISALGADTALRLAGPGHGPGAPAAHGGIR